MHSDSVGNPYHLAILLDVLLLTPSGDIECRTTTGIVDEEDRNKTVMGLDMGDGQM